MKKLLNLLTLTLACAALLAGCTTVYKTTVTLTEAEDAAMQAWATAHNDRLTTVDLDRKVMVAHARFLDAKGVALTALKAYQAGGDKAAYLVALETTRAAIGPLLDLIMPLITPAQAASLQTSVANAAKP